MTLGEKLKMLRVEKDLTLDELAAVLNKKYDLNLFRGTISRWENDAREPMNRHLCAYAKYFDVSLDWLLDMENQNNMDPIIERYAQQIKEDPPLTELIESAKGLSSESIKKACEFLRFLRTQEKEKG